MLAMSATQITDGAWRSFFRAVGGAGVRYFPETLPERPDPEVDADAVEDIPTDVRRTDPLQIHAYVDGVQNLAQQRWYPQGDPVLLFHVAAGAVTETGAIEASEERVGVLCSLEDEAWLLGEGCMLPIVAIPHPPDRDMLVRELTKQVDKMRLEAEQKVVSTLTDRFPHLFFVMDGSLAALPKAQNMVGVVKSLKKKYFRDESAAKQLQAGWRSPMFMVGNRYTAYLRLHPTGSLPWHFGLVRVEVRYPGLMNAACSAVWRNRQQRNLTDRRWAVHIQGVAATEQLLRARRPVVLT